MSRRDGLTAGAEALNAVMAAEREIYRAMLALAGREQSAIVEGDIQALTEIVDRKQELIDHLNALETERMTALVAIEAATGIDPEAATVSEIAAQLPAAVASSLTRAGRELRAEVVALEEANQVNARLLENSRALVGRWVHYLRSLLAGSLYTADGGSVASSGGRTLDRTA